MGKFFWGFFFIYLNFNLSVNAHTLNILPEFVGYFLLLQGLKELDEESGVFAGGRPFAVGMAVYTGILWVGALLGITGTGSWLSTLLNLVSTAVSLYISWAIIQGIREMEERHEAGVNSAESSGKAGRERWLGRRPRHRGVVCPDAGSPGGGGGCADGGTCGHYFAAGGLLAGQEMLGSGSGGNNPFER